MFYLAGCGKHIRLTPCKTKLVVYSKVDELEWIDLTQPNFPKIFVFNFDPKLGLCVQFELCKGEFDFIAFTYWGHFLVCHHQTANTEVSSQKENKEYGVPEKNFKNFYKEYKIRERGIKIIIIKKEKPLDLLEYWKVLKI